MTARVALVALAAALSLGEARPATAQALTTTTAACVVATGCTQLAFGFTTLGGSSLLIDGFDVWLGASAAWRFAPLQGGEAEDALGLTFFAPTVDEDDLHLNGVFDPGFEPLLAPSARVRAEVEPPDAMPTSTPSALDYVYRLTLGGRTLSAGTGGGAPRSSGRASCAGPSGGCDQVDFAFTMRGVGQTFDFFRLWLIGDDWRLAELQSGEAEDAWGPNFFAPNVADGGYTLEGAFDPVFAAIVEPSLRLRVEFAQTGAPLRFAYAFGYDGRYVTAGMGALESATTAPEPTTLALLATGVVIVATRAGRRRGRR